MRGDKKIRILGGSFKGALVGFDRRHSRRKLLGIYEAQLSPWFSEKIRVHSNYIDIGANDGYHTYGFAHAALRAGHKNVSVVAVEPVLTPELNKPRYWPSYIGANIEIVENYVGGGGEGGVALSELVGGMDSALIKIDVEGAEREIFDCNAETLRIPTLDFCVEIHGRDFIPEIAGKFCEAGRPFLNLSEKKVLFLPMESRAIYTSWLVTI